MHHINIYVHNVKLIHLISNGYYRIAFIALHACVHNNIIILYISLTISTAIIIIESDYMY